MKKHKLYFKLNLIIIFLVLNVWDFALNKVIFNAMLLGIIMFGPVAALWFLGKFKAVVILTLLSIIEFMMFLIFIAESIELSGNGSYSKSLFLLPYLVLAALNGIWGLSIYSKREGKIKK
jgi:hypothetical protein